MIMDVFSTPSLNSTGEIWYGLKKNNRKKKTVDDFSLDEKFIPLHCFLQGFLPLAAKI